MYKNCSWYVLVSGFGLFTVKCGLDILACITKKPKSPNYCFKILFLWRNLSLSILYVVMMLCLRKRWLRCFISTIKSPDLHTQVVFLTSRSFAVIITFPLDYGVWLCVVRSSTRALVRSDTGVGSRTWAVPGTSSDPVPPEGWGRSSVQDRPCL